MFDIYPAETPTDSLMGVYLSHVREFNAIATMSRCVSRQLPPELCGRSRLFFRLQSRVDHRLTLRVERDGADGLPVARVPRPATRVGRSCLAGIAERPAGGCSISIGPTLTIYGHARTLRRCGHRRQRSDARGQPRSAGGGVLPRATAKAGCGHWHRSS